MRSATLLLLLLLGLAACAAARRHKGPWFCHGRSCPHFKTVRGWWGSWAEALEEQCSRHLGPCHPPQLWVGLPPQLEDEGDYTKRCYARTTWAISCALDGAPLWSRRRPLSLQRWRRSRRVNRQPNLPVLPLHCTCRVHARGHPQG